VPVEITFQWRYETTNRLRTGIEKDSSHSFVETGHVTEHTFIISKQYLFME
jgi:hypothetical protein